MICLLQGLSHGAMFLGWALHLVMQTLVAHNGISPTHESSRSAAVWCAGPRGLWLEEFWRCHVVGEKPARMGTRGRVIGNAPATKAHLHTVFRCSCRRQC